MNLQEAQELKERIKNFYENETNSFIKYKLKDILYSLDHIVSVLRLEEAEKIMDQETNNDGIMNTKRVRERLEKLRSQLPEPQKCSRCPNPLFDSMASSDIEPYSIGDELVCRKCYFEALGDEVEKHPIGSGYLMIDESSNRLNSKRV